MASIQGIDALDEFVAEGMVRSVVSIIKSGKEATAYLCRGGPALDAPLAVAKVYHDRTRRDFANGGTYEVGKRMLDERGGRAARAIGKKTATGRELEGSLWVDHEFEILSALDYAGVRVPVPYVATSQAILMEYIGDESGPAPQLHLVRLSRASASTALDRLLWSIEEMLRANVIHGDLSPYNVLYPGDDEAVIIDLPQAIDPRFHRRAETFLARDVRTIAGYFERAGIPFDHDRWTADLWRRFVFSQL